MPFPTSDAAAGADGEADACPAHAEAGGNGEDWRRARFTIVEIASGLEPDTFQTEAEAVASLAFAGLNPDEVEPIADVSTMAAIASWQPPYPRSGGGRSSVKALPVAGWPDAGRARGRTYQARRDTREPAKTGKAGSRASEGTATARIFQQQEGVWTRRNPDPMAEPPRR